MDVMKMYPPALLTVVLLGSCGDAMRTPEYGGEPATMPLVVRVRLPDDFVLGPVSLLSYSLVNTRADNDPGGSAGVQTSPSDLTTRELQTVFSVPPDMSLLRSLPGASSGPMVSILRPSVSSLTDSMTAAVSLDDFVVYATGDSAAVFPLGLGGPSLTVKKGYQLVRRTCEPSGAVRFEALLSNTVLDLVSVPSPGQPTTPLTRRRNVEIDAFARCGLSLPPEDLGTRVEVGPPRLKPRGMVFHPQDGRLFFMPATAADEYVSFPNYVPSQIDSLDLTSGQMQTLVKARFFARGVIFSNDGRYLFATAEDTDPRADPAPYLARIDTTTGAVLKGPARGVPSPDGRLAVYTGFDATRAQALMQVHDFDSGMSKMLVPGVPLVWAPDSASLLSTRVEGSDWTLQAVKLDGMSELLGRNTVLGAEAWFWNAGGPRAVSSEADIGVFLTTIGAGNMPARTDTILTPEQGPSELVNMTAVAPAPGLVFVWSERCLGFGPSMCTARLHRYVIAQGKSTVVAVARTPMPVAVSPDGRRLALSSDGAVYVKELPDPAM
jgi:hypothetical protein